MHKPPTPLHFIYIWMRRQLCIKANSLGFLFSSKKKAKRQGKVSKWRSGILMPILMIFLYSFISFTSSQEALKVLNKQIPDKNPNLEFLHVPSLVHYEFERIERRIQNSAISLSDQEVKKQRNSFLKKHGTTSHEVWTGREREEMEFDSVYEYLNFLIVAESIPGISYEEHEAIAQKTLQHFIDFGPKDFKKTKRYKLRRKITFNSYQTETFLKWIGIFFLLTLGALTFLEGIGNKNPMMQAPEEDLEYLAHFPISTKVLFLMPLLQRAFLNVFAYIICAPAVTACFMALGYNFSQSLLRALPVAVCFAICLASLQICYQFLGRYNSQRWLRRLCSFMQIPGYALFCILLLASRLPMAFEFLRPLSEQNLGRFLPPNLIFHGIFTESYSSIILGLAITLIFPILAISFISFYSKGGLPTEPQDMTTSRKAVGKRKLLNPAALRLLRDRNYLISTLFSPIVLFIFYSIMIVDDGEAMSNNAALGMIFGACSFIILGSLVNLAAFEGPNLWLLFCSPKSITEALKNRIQFWMKVVFIFAIAILSVLYIYTPDNFEISRVIALLLGIPSLCYIAVTISFAAYPPNPHSTAVKAKASLVYLFMIIASMYIQSAIAGTPGAQFVSPVLFGILAMAMWIDHKRSISYYLDPDYVAPAELTLKNSMLWCLLFFGLQSLVFMFIMMANKSKTLQFQDMAICYGVASCVVTVLSLFWYKNKKLHKIPKAKCGSYTVFQALAFTIVSGVILVYLAHIYTGYMQQAFPDLFPKMNFGHKFWLYLLAVGFAPLFEEFLFRRLLLVALMKHLKVSHALLIGSLVFAVVHPLTSFPLVFCLGLACAYVYWRSGKLWIAMLLHALYNTGVIYLS